jgi:menaquinone-dependent protoporphyrinogen IX oxidase
VPRNGERPDSLRDQAWPHANIAARIAQTFRGQGLEVDLRDASGVAPDPADDLVLVSLTAAEDTEEARQATQRCIDDFLADTGWTPARAVAIAGALQ